MTMRTLLAIAAAVVVLLPHAAEAQRRADDWRPDNRTDWEFLGSAEIGTKLERDVIEVGRREGRFQSIGFTVGGSDVRIESLKVIYGGGEVDDLPVKEFIKAGTRSRPIDLPGRGQFIQRIEILYRSPGPVKIEFFGEKRREAQWQPLGCQRVGFLESKDTIRVGRREGAFRAIKLAVADSPLRLNRMRVVFGNGPAQTFDVKSVIPAGAETRAIDLDGTRRVIERIDLEYLPSISLKRGAQVCVLAIEGGPGWRGDRDGRDRDGRDRDRRY
ncbi:MAG: hypothetical protein AB7E66_16740 [Parvibaculaceae bacterium]